MEEIRLVALKTVPNPFNKGPLSDRTQELVEGHGMQGVSVHLADRRGIAFAIHRNTQKASGRHDTRFRHILVEVLQRSECAIRSLHFIEHYERPRHIDRPS